MDTLIGFVKNLNSFSVFLGIGYISFYNPRHNGFVTVNVVYFFSPGNQLTVVVFDPVENVSRGICFSLCFWLSDVFN